MVRGDRGCLITVTKMFFYVILCTYDIVILYMYDVFCHPHILYVESNLSSGFVHYVIYTYHVHSCCVTGILTSSLTYVTAPRMKDVEFLKET